MFVFVVCWGTSRLKIFQPMALKVLTQPCCPHFLDDASFTPSIGGRNVESGEGAKSGDLGDSSPPAAASGGASPQKLKQYN